ncbi:VOC family protein [Pseudorhodoferax sp.]|uniref:VOC family protein n=1 Tax=Pseudorhodoferax sp. TaxID=1993553 RepID=UPI002DD657EB|nr:VOC family protein [Pseudorhodoferax sp.]
MSAIAVDHLVVAADTLDEGVAWCETTLGVSPAAGGRHALMGTHNRLLALACEAYPQAYLEIIAIDPAAPAPGRTRWFGLDERAPGQPPRLIHWVGRSTMLDMHRWGLITLGQPPGDPVAASRDTPQGRLQWQILLRDDGRLACGGALPTLIQWQGGHAADTLPPSGVHLRALTLAGVPRRVRELLRPRGVHFIDAAPGLPALQAVLGTPRGDVALASD